MTLKELAIKEFQERNVEMQPLYPAVLVRVLPKKQFTDSGLFLTEDLNQKYGYEGIVLRTWSDRTVIKESKSYTLNCPVCVGEHVMFPHWSGEPCPGLDTEEYRLVPCRDYFGTVGTKDAGEIFVTLTNYKEGVQTDLLDIIRNYSDGLGPQNILDELNKEFEIIRKIKTSVTR